MTVRRRWRRRRWRRWRRRSGTLYSQASGQAWGTRFIYVSFSIPSISKVIILNQLSVRRWRWRRRRRRRNSGNLYSRPKGRLRNKDRRTPSSFQGHSIIIHLSLHVQLKLQTYIISLEKDRDQDSLSSSLYDHSNVIDLGYNFGEYDRVHDMSELIKPSSQNLLNQLTELELK